MVVTLLHPEFSLRQEYREQSPFAEVWSVLDKVYDPELPTVTIWGLGILKDIQKNSQGWQVTITPTYSGCPAVEAITDDIKTAMKAAGFVPVEVDIALAPAWSTDQMSPEAVEQLKALNIAPPSENDAPVCPQCGAKQTTVISHFGSTACKALYRCERCKEPFGYFKKI